MLAGLRKYGFLVFLVPVAVFWLDDYLTEWHHHGHDGIRRILVENIIEDLAVTLIGFILGRWYAAQTAGVHCECPSCHFRWMMHPKQEQRFCPHCGASEPG
jgi:ssDNA-binding Zn-finger/Zn-ribbon topoisomerase 1